MSMKYLLATHAFDYKYSGLTLVSPLVAKDLAMMVDNSLDNN